ncbi:MAG: biotin/lipoyl-containing protein [Ignavibacteria bacterium]|nr:biotin/lipoyl-containing protein [Ignavibacteria bacterium]
MRKFKLAINGNPYEVEIVNIEDTNAEVDVNGVRYQVEIEKKGTISKTPRLVRSVVEPSTDIVKSIQKTSSPSEVKGVGKIKSPLPGIILQIHVKVGDEVKIGHKLITLEAMKMENNINSDKEGKVLSIKVNTRDSVLEGDVLIEIGN